ncbi:MAG: EamA family transporter RarD [Micrococcaceae bacterium]
MTPPPENLQPSRRTRDGVLCAIGAYGMWGVLPLLFVVFTAFNPVDVLAWRIVCALVMCLLMLAVTRGWRRLAAVARRRREHSMLVLAGVLIAVNWFLYIVASTTGHVLEASLGYFINPLATIVLGVLVLRERLRPLQWVAVGVSVVAVAVLTWDYGALPWLSLALAGTFAVYGLVKNRLGSSVDPLTGMTVETTWLTVPAVVWLGVAGLIPGAGALGAGLVGAIDPWQLVALLATGVVTVTPLMLFAGASARLRLSSVGMFQYIAPILQFLVGYVVMGEQMSAGRWWGFGLVWVAVVLLLADVARVRRRNPAPRPPRRSV